VTCIKEEINLKNKRISDIYEEFIDDIRDETLDAWNTWEDKSKSTEDKMAMFYCVSVLLLLDLVR
jgi:hypothetical protein